MYIKNGQFRKHKYIISYVPPNIYLQPIGGTRKSGDSFTFNIKARGSNPLTYQWYRNSLPIFGETTDTLSIPSLNAQIDDGLYYCTVTNNKYSIDSDLVRLNVLTTITITEQPSSIVLNPNSKSTFNVTVTGDEPIIYQWYKNLTPIPYSSKKSYIIPYVKITDEGIYFCKISNKFDVLTSNFVSLSVNRPIQVVRIPSNSKINPNTNYSDYLSATGTNPITGYWRRNKVKFGSDIILNDGSITLSINNISNLSTGSYDCVLSNIVGPVTSNSFNIYVNERVNFTTNPVSANVLVNNPVTFSVSTSGTTPITYQWYSTDGLISGQTFSNFTINVVDFSSEKRYWCVASNMVNSVTSSMVQLSADIKSVVNDSGEYIVFDGGEYWVY
jgi:hypothetical protein